MPDGIKALLDVFFKELSFSESNSVFGDEKLTAFSFQFFWTC